MAIDMLNHDESASTELALPPANQQDTTFLASIP